MVKKYLNNAVPVLFVHENRHGIYKHYIQANLDCKGVAKKYQAHLQHKTLQNLAGICTYENINSIQACIYHGCYKISSKWHNGHSS